MLKHFTISAIVVTSLGLLTGCGKDEASKNGFIPIQTGSTNDVGASNNPSAGNTRASNKAPNTSSGSTDSNTPVTSKIKNLDRIYQTDHLDSTTIKTPGGDLKLWIMDTGLKE
jgi:hypothetical protein